MSILIKGMEMPKSCYDCRFHEVYGYEDGERRVCELNWEVLFGDEWGLLAIIGVLQRMVSSVHSQSNAHGKSKVRAKNEMPMHKRMSRQNRNVSC